MTTSTMQALTVTSWGATPVLTSVPLPPSPSADQTRLQLLASGLPQLVRSQAAGTHYSVQGAALPYVPGIDGVGYTSDKKLVYAQLLTNKPQGGGFADYVNADNRAVTPISLAGAVSEGEERAIGIKVAALINPSMSSWMALKYRAHVDTLKTEKGSFNVLILGVTSASGRIAAFFSRHLGAKSVVGAARNVEELEKLKKIGIIDHAITLDKTDAAKSDFGVLGQLETFPHVVLDYIWGSTALAVMNALPRSANQAENLEVRYVQIGTLGREAEIALPGPLLRSKNIFISGAGPGSWSVKALAKENEEMIKAIVNVLPNATWKDDYGVVERTLEDVESAWEDKQRRTVFVMA